MELELKGAIREDELLNEHTYFKIGGPCRAFVEPADIDELKKTLDFAEAKGISYIIIGAGCNLLVNDKGFDGFVISLSAECFTSVRFLQDEVCAGAGMKLGRLCELLAEAGFSGLEFLSGTPGTVGGAVMMNAGGKFGTVGDCIEQVKVMDKEGEVRFIAKKDMGFSYRSSNLKDLIILEARFLLKKDEQVKILGRMRSFLEEKKLSQDLASPSAGCIFKNPEGAKQKSAGELIDLCGLKGRTVGGARVSDVHANFIINTGKAKASDVLELMGIVKDAVKKDHGISLEPEVKII